MDEKDSGWVIDQIMGIQAPEAVKMIEKTMSNLLDETPRPARRRASEGGD
jgi:hypothetical protein